MSQNRRVPIFGGLVAPKLSSMLKNSPNFLSVDEFCPDPKFAEFSPSSTPPENGDQENSQPEQDEEDDDDFETSINRSFSDRNFHDRRFTVTEDTRKEMSLGGAAVHQNRKVERQFSMSGESAVSSRQKATLAPPSDQMTSRRMDLLKPRSSLRLVTSNLAPYPVEFLEDFPNKARVTKLSTGNLSNVSSRQDVLEQAGFSSNDFSLIAPGLINSPDDSKEQFGPEVSAPKVQTRNNATYHHEHTFHEFMNETFANMATQNFRSNQLGSLELKLNDELEITPEPMFSCRRSRMLSTIDRTPSNEMGDIQAKLLKSSFYLLI